MDYKQFKEHVYGLTCIDLNCYKERQMKRRIDVLIGKHQFKGYQDYYQALKSDRQLYDEFVGFITINVSEFFRNPEQWRVLEKDILPVLMERQTKKLRVWSAACSTGDEPYSLVMMLFDYLPKEQIDILATDLDRCILQKAKEGIFHKKSLSNLPAGYIDQYFEKLDEFRYRISDEVKNCVQFRQHDLTKHQYPVGHFDMIICRNVVIYFTDETKRSIYEKFNRSLKEQGILFVGNTEQIADYRSLHYDVLKSFFYQKNTQK